MVQGFMCRLACLVMDKGRVSRLRLEDVCVRRAR